MPFPDLFKLEKLRIEAYEDRARLKKKRDAFVAMFNPTTLTQTFANEYQAATDIGGVAQEARFVRKQPADLQVKLLLDGTGVERIGLAKAGATPPRPVADRIAELLKVAYRVDGDTHEPAFLWVKWGRWGTELGQAGYKCRLKSLGITYQSFDRDGAPLRAELDLAFVSDEESDAQLKAAGLASPDVPHSRVVRAGDTLPALVREVYGSPARIATVARANDLDQLRTLRPGSELVFPELSD